MGARSAIVTGSARGIGAAIAQTLLRMGVKTALVDKGTQDSCSRLLEQCAQLGTPYLYIQADIATDEGRRRIVDSVGSAWGSVDILVNNAGIPPQVRTDLLYVSESSYDEVLNVNLKGTFFLTQLVAQKMVTASTGLEERAGCARDTTTPEGYHGRCIIMISSSNARAAAIDRAEYSVSKAGVSMLTKLWAVRLSQHDIPVYEIRPGLILTEMTAPVRSKYDALIESGFLLQKRWGMPEDVARAVASLVRGDLSYSTGQVLYVDGGQFVEHF